MVEKHLFIDGNFYTREQIVEAIKESESFRLNFVESMMIIMLDERDFRIIDKLKLVPDMKQLVHFREHFIMSVGDFYGYEEYGEADFELMCNWQVLARELLIGMQKSELSVYEGDKKCNDSCGEGQA